MPRHLLPVLLFISLRTVLGAAEPIDPPASPLPHPTVPEVNPLPAQPPTPGSAPHTPRLPDANPPAADDPSLPATPPEGSPSGSSTRADPVPAPARQPSPAVPRP